MIFDAGSFCRAAEAVEWDGAAPLTLGGPGLWVGVVSRGGCALGGALGGAPGRVGDVLLGPAPPVLTADAPCHFIAVRLVGQCADRCLLELPAARFADGAACPGAAELLADVLAAQAGGAVPPALAFALLCSVARADETARPLPPLVAEALKAIQSNYMALYGVEELSVQLGVSKSHLVRVFRQAVGVPPGKYLTTVRLNAAKRLLLAGGYNLEMIAGLCGFSGANYFCRVFRRETGLSPAAWRAAARPRPAAPDIGEEIFV